VVQQLPQDARRKVQRLKLESRHLSQLHVLKGAAQAMLTTSELALQMQPDDAEVFHLQAELSEIQTKLKLVVEGIDKKEAISLNNVVAVASNLLDLKDEIATPEDRPQNFFRPSTYHTPEEPNLVDRLHNSLDLPIDSLAGSEQDDLLQPPPLPPDADDEEAVMAYRNAAVAKAQESEEGFGEWWNHRPMSPIDLELLDTQELDTGLGDASQMSRATPLS